MNFAIGSLIAFASILGGYAAMGGHRSVIWQPWEFVIIGGAALGTFIIANPIYTIKDTGVSIWHAILSKSVKTSDYMDVLGLLCSLLQGLRSKGKGAIEGHVDSPESSSHFQAHPTILGNKQMTTFICDYFRLMIIGSAKTHEFESLIDEELETISKDLMKPYHALSSIAEFFPPLGIVAAVLSVIKAMGALDQSPELLGALIGQLWLRLSLAFFIPTVLLLR
jgi:chemotaxis protein MotA